MDHLLQCSLVTLSFWWNLFKIIKKKAFWVLEMLSYSSVFATAGVSKFYIAVALPWFYTCKGLIANLMQLHKPKGPPISVLFSLGGSWSVSSWHYEPCSKLCEEGEGAYSSLPGLGFTFCSCAIWVSSLPAKSPWNHKGSSSTKGLCPQVSIWRLGLRRNWNTSFV